MKSRGVSREGGAHRAAAGHVAAYLLRPSRARPSLSIVQREARGGDTEASEDALVSAAGDAAEARLDAAASAADTRADDEAVHHHAEAAAFVAREWRAIRALASVLLERETLRAEEADLIVDVARGDATSEELRHYRAVARQRGCGIE